ncbi:MAG: hypothetical protein E6772_11345 [Dysgonomonas sp.]|nr:hypothetical protein [Dysgonomonas sp.]
MKNYYTSIMGIILLYLLILSPNVNAQVTIGSSGNPDPNALMDLKEDDNTGESEKGLLLPRVALIGPNVSLPLPYHVKGMLVYNEINTDSLTIGLYKNTGTQWVPIQLPSGSSADQFLVINEESLTPRWVTKYIPDPTQSDQYSLDKAEAFKFTTGHIFPATENHGGVTYAENATLSTSWHEITDPITITPTNADNKIIIFLQTNLLQSPYVTGGTQSYAGGIFLNNQLKGVRMGVISSSVTTIDISTPPVSKPETLFFVLENLPVQANTIRIAFIKRTRVGGATDLYIGRDIEVNGTIYPGSTSLSYEFYEKN